jgi:signal transduction histidine kinase
MKRNLFRGFFFAALWSVSGLLIHHFITPHFMLLPFIVAYPMIFGICSFWGLAPALLSIAIWVLALSYFFFAPVFTFKIVNPVELLHLAFFGAGAALMSLLAHAGRIRELRQQSELHSQRLREAQAQMRAQQLEQDKLLREEFVNSLTHDLRNPVQAAKLGLDMLLRQVDDPERVQRSGVRISRDLDRAQKMISDLLDARRVQSGSPLQMEFSDFDLAELCRQLVDDSVLLYGDRFELCQPATLEVHWCEKYLRRALENLISNAVKYGTNERRIQLEVRELPEGEVDVGVRNFGNPLSSEDILNIFRPFHRLEQGSILEGWGIGLTLIDATARGHGGRVEVTSGAAEGTCFHMLLPKTNPTSGTEDSNAWSAARGPSF